MTSALVHRRCYPIRNARRWFMYTKENWRYNNITTTCARDVFTVHLPLARRDRMSYGPRSGSTAAQLLLPIHNNNNARSLSAKDVIAAFFLLIFIRRRRRYDYFTNKRKRKKQKQKKNRWRIKYVFIYERIRRIRAHVVFRVRPGNNDIVSRETRWPKRLADFVPRGLRAGEQPRDLNSPASCARTNVLR